MHCQLLRGMRDRAHIVQIDVHSDYPISKFFHAIHVMFDTTRACVAVPNFLLTPMENQVGLCCDSSHCSASNHGP